MFSAHTLLLQDICSALLQNRQIGKDRHNLSGLKHRVMFVTKLCAMWDDIQFIQEVKGRGTDLWRITAVNTVSSVNCCVCERRDQHLVFGVRRVDALPVSAGLQQDVNGVELQEDFTGHAVEEGDIRQRCRGQQKHFAAGRALTQTCRHTRGALNYLKPSSSITASVSELMDHWNKSNFSM